MSGTALKKELSLFSLVMIAIGATIGSGIFRTPNEIAQYLPSVGWMTLVWVVGGVVSIFGALSFGELAGMYPKAGGFYNYLRDAFGDFWAFLYGWSMLLIICSGSTAALALVFSDYLEQVILISKETKLVVAAMVILFHTLINTVGVEWGSKVAVIFTLAKLFGIALLLVIGFYLGSQQVNITDFSFIHQKTNETSLMSSFGLALIGVTFSFLGYHYITFMSGEVENAKRNVPKALAISIAVVTVVYVLMIIAYQRLLPFSEFLTSEGVAADAVGKAWQLGGKFVAVLICVSVFGTIGVNILTIPRIIYAMAQDGLFFKSFGRAHSRFNTPHRAVVLTGSWSIVLLFVWETFSNLISYVTFVNSIFFVMTALTLVVFRKRKITSAYRTWGFPITTWIFIMLMAFISVNTLLEMPSQSIGGIVLLLFGWVGFKLMKTQNKTSLTQEIRENQDKNGLTH